MARVRGRRERRRVPAAAWEFPGESLEPSSVIGASELGQLGKLQDAFVCETKRVVGSRGPSLPAWSLALLAEIDEGDVGEDVVVCDGASECAKTACSVRCEYVRTTKLAGVFTSPDGSQAAAVPGYGHGVPPSTDIERSAVITLHPDKPPIVLTSPGDGENLLWAPTLGWKSIAGMPFYSVSTRHREAAALAPDPTWGRDDASAAPGMQFLTNRQARAQERKESEAVRREREAKRVQHSHLDSDREKFIAREMNTTVLRPLNFQITEQSFRELEDKRILFGLPAPGEATNRGIPNTPRGLLHMVRRRHKGLRTRAVISAGQKAPEPELAVEETPTFGSQRRVSMTPGALAVTAATPSHLGTTSASGATQRRGSAALGGHGHPHSAVVSEGGEVVVPASDAPRSHVQISCLAVHPQIPRVIAGIGDGQVAVYHVYRAHGRPRPELHQTQGFDASRKSGDVATAAYVPTGPLAQEGALNTEAFVIGFASGRVAVFEVKFPSSLRNGMCDMRASEESKPILNAAEPLLLDHYHCDSRVQSVLWHPILGILSIGRDGSAMFVDTAGNLTCRIACVAGRDVFVSDGDLSLELEQLAAAGQRGIHLWQCFSQAKMGVLEPSRYSVKRSTTMVLAVRYLPGQHLLMSAHELQGEVRVWDALRLELLCSSCVPQCPRATSVTWDPMGMVLLVFGPMGVAEVLVATAEEDAGPRRGSAGRRWSGHGAAAKTEEDWAKFAAVLHAPSAAPAATGGAASARRSRLSIDASAAARASMCVDGPAAA